MHSTAPKLDLIIEKIIFHSVLPIKQLAYFHADLTVRMLYANKELYYRSISHHMHSTLTHHAHQKLEHTILTHSTEVAQEAE